MFINTSLGNCSVSYRLKVPSVPLEPKPAIMSRVKRNGTASGKRKVLPSSNATPAKLSKILTCFFFIKLYYVNLYFGTLIT